MDWEQRKRRQTENKDNKETAGWNLFSEVFIPKTSSANGAKTAVFLILQFMYGRYV